MAEPKTKPSAASAEEFLAEVTDERRRTDAQALCALMAEATGAPPVMWGGSIVGFGTYHYRYASGREGDWPPVGLAPRKQALTVYLAEGFDRHGELLARLGPVTTGKGCLYIKRLDAVDQAALRELITLAFESLNGRTISS
ncbi:hypothetical protein GCM10010193_11690 [Kitasatospora atroaurantiaca]|uniref:Uncharacterized protein DUF1801 n=1 Tax=Kitasatospora atroaurantiaca TaxID=285545 RepID=A0A561EQG7_9ACTN|nr:DUF1801 domain-containing protein [Kitasatospora atroaurantiaca]TWE17861.1 uncharacterized protein DUF1801 [Kitasatospora atroaurantiaca]